jgi:hypothetical protein
MVQQFNFKKLNCCTNAQFTFFTGGVIGFNLIHTPLTEVGLTHVLPLQKNKNTRTLKMKRNP